MSRAIFALGCLMVMASAAVAQTNWPNRPVRILTPSPAGGSSENTVRAFADPLSMKIGQQFLVEAKPGGGGNIMADTVAKATPDGYTFGMTTAATHGVASAAFSSLPFDPMKDFSFVARFVTIPNILLVQKDSPFRTLQELIAYAKANPGKLNFGSLGPGTTTHLTGVSFALAAGIDIVHVPYKGSAPLSTALLSREIDFGFDQIAGSLGQVKGGAMRALAITSKDRSSELPDTPTIAESGYPGFDFATWYGIVAPAGTPRPILEKFADEIQATLAKPEVIARYHQLGTEPSFLPLDDFRSFANKEIDKWGPVVKASGLKVE